MNFFIFDPHLIIYTYKYIDIYSHIFLHIKLIYREEANKNTEDLHVDFLKHD